MSRRTLLIIGFIAFAAIIVLVAVVIPRQQQLMRESRAKAEHERAQKYFQKLKRGGLRYPAIDSPELMLMIANDPDCAKQLTYIHFDMTDLNAPEFKEIQKLPNVATISFYDCGGITTLLSYASNMPSVNVVHFDYITPSDELLKRLALIPNLKTLRFNNTDKGELDVFKRACRMCRSKSVINRRVRFGPVKKKPRDAANAFGKTIQYSVLAGRA